MLFFVLIGVDVVVVETIIGFVNKAELTVVATDSIVDVVAVETVDSGIDNVTVHSVAGGGGVGGIAGGVAVGIGGVAIGGWLGKGYCNPLAAAATEATD